MTRYTIRHDPKTGNLTLRVPNCGAMEFTKAQAVDLTRALFGIYGDEIAEPEFSSGAQVVDGAAQ